MTDSGFFLFDFYQAAKMVYRSSEKSVQYLRELRLAVRIKLC